MSQIPTVIEPLPLKADVETRAVLRKTALAHKALAELKGVITSIPNQNILTETLTLREARESSAVENIISTFAEVYQSSLFDDRFASPAAKEVHLYAKALKTGFGLVKKNGLLTNNLILQIQELIKRKRSLFRQKQQCWRMEIFILLTVMAGSILCNMMQKEN